MADSANCEIPCEGIYADIFKENIDEIDESNPGMKEVMEAYENYKNQFLNEIPFPFSIRGYETSRDLGIYY